MNDTSKKDKPVATFPTADDNEQNERGNNRMQENQDDIPEVDDKLIGDDLAIAEAAKTENDKCERGKNDKNNY